MHRIRTVVTGAAVSAAILVDPNMVPCNIGFGCVVSATATYTVQHTFDDLHDSTITPVWFNHPFVAAATANADGNYAMPITAYRLNVSGSTGTVTMTSIQGMHP